MALSDTKLRSISGKAYEGSPEISDGDGLSARITPSGTVTFQFRYRWNGKPVRLTVGRYPATTLKDARVIVGEMRTLYMKGINPKNYFARSDGMLTLKECLTSGGTSMHQHSSQTHKHCTVPLCTTLCTRNLRKCLYKTSLSQCGWYSSINKKRPTARRLVYCLSS